MLNISDKDNNKIKCDRLHFFFPPEINNLKEKKEADSRETKSKIFFTEQTQVTERKGA